MERKENSNESDSESVESTTSDDVMFDTALNVNGEESLKRETLDETQWIKTGDGFACKICKKVLRRAYDIKRHIQCVHHNERPYKCGECGSKFKLAFHLKEHQLTHLAVRPFKCYYCNRRFTRKRDITKHCKRMHKKQFTVKDHSVSDTSTELSTN